MSQKAILFGPFVGELYWEIARFAMYLPFCRFREYKNTDIKYVVFTRPERFDIYGRYADSFIPLVMPGDYKKYKPNCYKLNNLSVKEYEELALKFRKKQERTYNIVKHVYPKIDRRNFMRRDQFKQEQMIFKFKPRKSNYKLIDSTIPNDKPIVLIAPRWRAGFRRNWRNWSQFYDLLASDEELMDRFNFVLCGHSKEYIPDEYDRFYDMTRIPTSYNSSTVGLLFVLLDRCCFVFGSQSAIPNLGLLFKKPVLMFGHQKTLHTVTYNIFKSPVSFVEDMKYNISSEEIFKIFKQQLERLKQ